MAEGRRRKPLEEIWYIMHALLLRENALKIVLLTRIKLGLILEEPLLLPLVKLWLSPVHLSHLSQLL